MNRQTARTASMPTPRLRTFRATAMTPTLAPMLARLTKGEHRLLQVVRALGVSDDKAIGAIIRSIYTPTRAFSDPDPKAGQ